jgi:hypothetical protein
MDGGMMRGSRPVPFFIDGQHVLTVINALVANVAVIRPLNDRKGDNQIPTMHALQMFPVLVNCIFGLVIGRLQPTQAFLKIVQQYFKIMRVDQVTRGSLTVAHAHTLRRHLTKWLVVVAGQQQDIPLISHIFEKLINLIHQLSWIRDCCIIFAYENVVPLVLNGEFQARNVAHAAPHGTVAFFNGRKPLCLQSDFIKFHLEMIATVDSGIKIDVKHMFDVMELPNHFRIFELVFINE